MIRKLGFFHNTIDKRRLLGNFISLSVLRGFDFLIPLITLPYLVRVVGMEKFGLINFSLSLALYFGAIIQYGFGVSATREIARNRDDVQKISKIYSTTLSATILLSMISLLVFLLIVVLIGRFSQHSLIYFFTILFVLFQSLFPIWFFQGMERMKFISYLTLTGKALFVFGLFTFVTHEADFYLIPLLNLFSSLFGFVASLWIIKFRFKVKFIFSEVSDIKQLLVDGRHSFVSQLAPNLYNNTSTFLLGIFTNNAMVGNYTAALKVIDALMSAGTIITNTFLPYLARNINKHALYFKIMLTVGIIFSLFAVFFSEWIAVTLYGHDNMTISTYIKLLAFFMLFIFFRNSFGVNYLMLTGHERVYKNIVLYVSIISFVFALVLVPLLEIYGAIVVMLGSSFLMAILTYINYRKVKNNESH